MSQFGLFDFSDRLVALSAFGDPLERLSQVVDFEIFRPSLESDFNFSDGSQGGRPPYDAVLIFKVLILQSLYSLSDDQTEYQIKDRLSFMRFLGLDLCQNVPGAKTIWLYRERLKKKDLMDRLFSLFGQMLRERGYLAMSGQIVDASLIQAPRQRMTKEEKTQVKAGKIPEDWKAHPAKLAQKDQDARWVVKYTKAKGEGKALDLAIPFFGYKNHVSIDRRYGFIRKYI
jgi:IS5 family transposase